MASGPRRQKHPRRQRLFSFRVPDDPDQPIWRYMDFARYAAMLLDQGLHFIRADQLTDPYEGVPLRKDGARHHRGTSSNADTEAIKRRTFVSSWHANDFESAAMWQL